MARIPDRTEHQRRFLALDFAERRAIIKAVNRGIAVDVRKHAPLAVGVARRQQRFWRYGWLIGPAMGVVQIAFVPLEAALLNAAFGTMAIGLVSWFWLSRARRAERLNLEVAEGRRRPGDSTPTLDGQASTTRFGWFRGRAGDTAAASGATAGTSGGGDAGRGAASRSRSNRGHLPSRASIDSPPEPQPRPQPAPETIDPVRRPYRPRGRKRRS